MYIKKAIFRKSHTTNVNKFTNVDEGINLQILMKEGIYQC